MTYRASESSNLSGSFSILDDRDPDAAQTAQTAQREDKIRAARCPKVTERNSRSLWTTINEPTSRRQIIRISRFRPQAAVSGIQSTAQIRDGPRSDKAVRPGISGQARDGALYDASWGTRMKGGGPYADLLAKRFHLAAKRHGL